MTSSSSQESVRLRITDEELLDEIALVVELLNGLAKRWPFRIKAGRLGTHTMGEVLALADALEGAARSIQAPAPTGEIVPAAHERPAAELERSERFRLL